MWGRISITKIFDQGQVPTPFVRTGGLVVILLLQTLAIENALFKLVGDAGNVTWPLLDLPHHPSIVGNDKIVNFLFD